MFLSINIDFENVICKLFEARFVMICLFSKSSIH